MFQLGSEVPLIWWVLLILVHLTGGGFVGFGALDQVGVVGFGALDQVGVVGFGALDQVGVVSFGALDQVGVVDFGSLDQFVGFLELPLVGLLVPGIVDQAWLLPVVWLR